MGFVDSMAATLAVLAALPGIKHGYDKPPINVNKEDFPFFIAYPFEGEMTPISAGLDRGLHTAIFELHQSRIVTPESLVAVEPWPEIVMNALIADSTLAPLNTMVSWPMMYKAGPLEYGKNIHYGIRFEIVLKIH